MERVRSSNWTKIAWLVLLLALPLLLIALPMEWFSGDRYTICIWKNIAGADCWGCGITRSILSAVRLNLVEAWYYNRLIVVVFPLVLWLWVEAIRRAIKSLKPTV